MMGRPNLRRLLAVAAVGVAAVVAPGAQAQPAHPKAPGQHIFMIVLENKTYDETFGPTSPAPYLSKTLPSQGVLLRQYFGTGHLSLDNYVSMVSGQAPNPQTQGDCQYYTEFVSPNAGALDANGQALGDGCVYPKTVRTVADQLEDAGRSWRGYMEGMGTPCRHPQLNGADSTQKASATDEYAARHNPFVYFHTIVDDPARCASHVVDLSQLQTDLATSATTPSFSFITPDLCHDGHDAPCANGEPGGLVSADAFLQSWVPKITSSPAFQDNGILIVAFDESEATGKSADATACCFEPHGPNTPLPGITGPGGGRMGAVVISAKTVPGTVSDEPYNHYSLLRTIEDLNGLSHLGYAAQTGLRPFGVDVFTASR